MPPAGDPSPPHPAPAQASAWLGLRDPQGRGSAMLTVSSGQLPGQSLALEGPQRWLCWVCVWQARGAHPKTGTPRSEPGPGETRTYKDRAQCGPWKKTHLEGDPRPTAQEITQPAAACSPRVDAKASQGEAGALLAPQEASEQCPSLKDGVRSPGGRGCGEQCGQRGRLPRPNLCWRRGELRHGWGGLAWAQTGGWASPSASVPDTLACFWFSL